MIGQYRYHTHISFEPAVEPAVAAAELEKIWEKNHNVLTPQIVVCAARPENSTLHKAFDWDDRCAAERFREHQARELIRSIQIVVPDSPSRPVFIHVPRIVNNEGVQVEQHYQHVSFLSRYPAEFKAAVDSMKRRIAHLEDAVQSVLTIAFQTDAQNNVKKINLIANALQTARKLSEQLVQ